MKVLNLLASGGTGGIEVLYKNIALKSNIDNTMCYLFEEGETYQYLKSRGIKVLSLKNKNRNLIKIVNEIVQYCVQENIDIIAAQHGGMSCNIVYILLKKRLKNVKFVRTLHGSFDKYSFGNSNNKLKNFMIKIVMGKALKISDLIVYVSKAVKDSFEKSFKLDKINNTVIYNGMGEEFYNTSSLKEKNQKKDLYEIVYIGRVNKVKGIDRIIRVVSQITDYKINLTIVGDGEERKNLEDLVEKLNISKKVKFMGFQSNVIQFLDQADIFVYPSIWEEAFGISVVEAMARGCIPLVSNKGGLPEVIGKHTEYLFDTEQELKNKIETILRKGISEENMQEMKEQAKKFTIEKTIERLEEEYNKII